MPTTTTEERERRRGLVAFLHALGYGPYQVARAVGVAPPTIYRDLAAIESEWGSHLTAPQAVAQVRGVSHRLSGSLTGYLNHPDPKVRVMAVGALWTVFEKKLRLEQALGAVPKVADQVEVEVGMGREMLDTIFQALVNRVSADAQLEIEMALRSLDKEQPNLLDAEQPNLDKRPLGPPGEEDGGGPAAGTGRRRRLDKGLGFSE